jgi:hypothetical protein
MKIESAKNSGHYRRFWHVPGITRFKKGGNWLDCLDEEIGENNIWSEKLLSRWKHMSSKERGCWLLGRLWNDRSILPSGDCAVLEIPRGSSYAQGVRKLKNHRRHELRLDNRTAA